MTQNTLTEDMFHHDYEVELKNLKCLKEKIKVQLI